MQDNDRDKIETTLAHQEQQIGDLSDMVNRQWQEIEKLNVQINRLQAKIGEMEAISEETDDSEPLSIADIAAQEKPPHY